MKHTKLIFGCLLVVSLIFGLLLLIQTCSKSEDQLEIRTVLLHKTGIYNGVKYDLQPFVSQQGGLYIEVQLESFQHADKVHFDLSEVALIEDDRGETYLPKFWQRTKESEYNQTGYLIFDPISKDAKSIKLILYSAQNVAFSWRLNEK